MRTRLLAALCVVALAAAACGNSGDDGGEAADTTTTAGGGSATTAGDTSTFVHLDEPGVTDDEIRLTVVASITNPLGTDYGAMADGMNAYFDMVNSEGGIYGRDLVVSNVRDDQLGNNLQEVQAAISQDNAFAVGIAALLFTGAEELQKEGIPTFGWNINPEWSDRDALFPNLGALCFGCKDGRTISWLALQADATKVGIVGYGNSEQSKLCAEGDRGGVERYADDTGLEVAFYDDSLQFGQPDMSAQVDAMKKAGVDFVTTCMDLNGVLTLEKEMDKQGMGDVPFHHPNLYDADFVAENAQYFEGDYVIPQFLAFEHDVPNEQRDLFFEWTDKAGVEVKELTMIGWIEADQFVTGLKAAGPEFTRQKVIDALNTMTYDAGGLIVPIDWTKQHNSPIDHPEFEGQYECFNAVQVVDGEFESVFADDNGAWVCWPNDPDPQWSEPENMSFG